MYAKDYRAQARAALKGRWLFTTLLVLLALLLGAGSLSDLQLGNVSFNFGNNNTVVQEAEPMDLKMASEIEGEELMEMVKPAAIVFGAVFTIIILLVIAYSLFLGGYVRVGLVKMLDSLYEGEAPRAGMLFPSGVYWRSVRLNLLRGLYVFLWSLLLIIPGIIACYRYTMADYLLYKYPEMGAADALRESKRRMQGRKWRKFCLELSFIGWGLLCMAPSLLGAIIGGALLQMHTPVSVFFGVILLILGVIVNLAASYFLETYISAAVVAFYRDAERCVNWQDETREDGEYIEAAYTAGDAGYSFAPAMPHLQDAAPVQSVLTADETVAKDMFFDYKCSRRRMQDAGVLQEYEDLNASPISQERWKREYGDILMRRFDQDASVLDDILDFAAEYGAMELSDRELSRIERHIRQESLPDAEILNMSGRMLALITSGAFDDNEGFVSRKKQQVSDMADRLEHRLNANEAGGEWQKALQLIRRMCE